MTRREAATLGLRFFDVARPCKHDGDLQRYTASGRCVTCSKRSGTDQAAQIAALLATSRRQA